MFLHGGIGPNYVSMSISKINKLYFEGQEATGETWTTPATAPQPSIFSAADCGGSDPSPHRGSPAV